MSSIFQAVVPTNNNTIIFKPILKRNFYYKIFVSSFSKITPTVMLKMEMSV